MLLFIFSIPLYTLTLILLYYLFFVLLYLLLYNCLMHTTRHYDISTWLFIHVLL
nr:MAG TPA: hypothetical protein [Caudoviricetes sp.]